MTYQSMIETAYTVMSKRKRAVEFPKLFEEVCGAMKLDPTVVKNKKAQLYSDLMLDPRFTSLKDNKWDLKERHSFKETHIKLDEIVAEEDEVDEEEEEDEPTLKSSEDEY